MSDTTLALGRRSPDPLAALLSLNKSIVSTVNNMQIGHPDAAALDAMVAQNDATALATPASNLRGLVARLRHLVDLVGNVDDSYTLDVARACRADAEILALPEFGSIPDYDE